MGAIDSHDNVDFVVRVTFGGSPKRGRVQQPNMSIVSCDYHPGFQDAQLLLKLLLNNDFPRIWVAAVGEVSSGKLHESDKSSCRNDANPQQDRNGTRNLRPRRQNPAFIPRCHIPIDGPMENQRMHPRQK
jgi:hypothetical protein